MPAAAPAMALPAALVAGATVLPDRYAVLPLLPKDAVICEVGVALGWLSLNFINVCQPRHFIAIDNFRLHESREFWGHPSPYWFGAKTHAAWFRDEFAGMIAAGAMTVIEAESDMGIGQLDDSSVDVMYIDADHSYEATRRDLEAAARKLRPDGILIVNDYILVDQLGSDTAYGVIHATNEFMLEHNWALRYFALQTSMYCDVVLQRADARWPGTADGAKPVLVPEGVLTPGHSTPAERANAVLTARLTRLDTENSVLRREIETLRASISWRITAPLRAAGALLARQRRPEPG
jgi:hypothetical protein